MKNFTNALMLDLARWAEDEADARQFLETGVVPATLKQACQEAVDDDFDGVPAEDRALCALIATL